VESNSIILVEMGSCWFGVHLSHIACKGVGHAGEAELWAPSSFSCPQRWQGE
jgi:hypothetical protein